MQPTVWRRLHDGIEYRSAYQARAQQIVAAPVPASIPLSYAQMQQRAKRDEATETKSHADIIRRWCSTVPPPCCKGRYAHMGFVADCEEVTLSTMRVRRNAVLWPWIIASGLRPGDLAAVGSSEVPAPFRELCCEIFTRLVTLRSAEATPMLKESTFYWFFESMCRALFPGSSHVAQAYLEDEWSLSEHTRKSVQAAAHARREFPAASHVTDTIAIAVPRASSLPAIGKATPSGPAATDETAMSLGVDYALFTALVRVLLEPSLHTAGAHPSVSPHELTSVFELLVLPQCFSEDALQRLTVAPKGDDRAAAAARSNVHPNTTLVSPVPTRSTPSPVPRSLSSLSGAPLPGSAIGRGSLVSLPPKGNLVSFPARRQVPVFVSAAIVERARYGRLPPVNSSEA
jgi:hypothetical protein